MMRLLMLDFDQRLLSAVTRALAQEGVEVVGVQCVERAHDYATSRRFDVAVLDCDLLQPPEMAVFSDLPIILTTSFLEPEGEHQFFRHARLLRKPFTSTQLLSALHEACGAPHSLAGGFVDVLRRAHTDGLSLALRVGDAKLFMERGELVHAELLGLNGECALAELLAQPKQRISTIESTSVPRTIHRSFQALLLDLLCNLEERERREPPRAPFCSTRPSDKEPYS